MAQGQIKYKMENSIHPLNFPESTKWALPLSQMLGQWSKVKSVSDQSWSFQLYVGSPGSHAHCNNGEQIFIPKPVNFWLSKHLLDMNPTTAATFQSWTQELL